MTTTVSPVGKVIKIGGKPATTAQINQLKGEASQFRKTLLYQVLLETVKWEGQEIIFNKAQNFQDVLNGKMMLHVVGVQENIMNLLE